jgi:uncharacterized protein (DUF58 family)
VQAVQSLQRWMGQRTERWLAANLPPGESIRLRRSNIFILPTAQGLLFIGTAMIIFVAAINYGLSLAFALAFLMVSLFLITILHSFHNLRGLTLKGLGAEPVFAGEAAHFHIVLHRDPNRRHESLRLRFLTGDSADVSLIHTTEQHVPLAVSVPVRGRFRAPRIIVESSFPLGLWRAWSRLDLSQVCVVYPRPLDCYLDSIGGRAATGESNASSMGTEDFHGMRDYQPGDSPRQIAWKTLARGQGLKVKQFVDAIEVESILDWNMFPELDPEDRLSSLCHLALKMDAAGCRYGIRIPGVEIAPDRGEQHRRQVLEALALWP